jgi:hypothetical protein
MPPAAIRSTTWYRPSSVISAWSRPGRRAGRSGMVLLEIFASRWFLLYILALLVRRCGRQS